MKINRRFHLGIRVAMLSGILFFTGLVSGQTARQFISAEELGIQGRLAHDGPLFHRVDTASHTDMPQNPKTYFTHSAGMFISFRTNSSQIAARWCTSPSRPYNNLSGIAFEGLDLYIKRGDTWVHAGVGRPGSTACQEGTLVSRMDTTWKECLLYLPLYDETISLEIGIDTAASIQSAPSPFQHLLPVYGTSITQGASASRPGLAYPAQLSRRTQLNFVNLGISGSAKMEDAVAHMIAAQPLDGLIIDCVANCSVQNIEERTATFIGIIRASHPDIPIITLEGAPFESGNFDQHAAADMPLRNQYFRREIERLQSQDPHLYLIPADGLMGNDHEGTIDGVHPNDLGFERMLHIIAPRTQTILQKYNLLIK